ncbi:GNAT family N-acetyltransferase [Skermanella stibiiresistens]|uniref:GNAT family N-acetyltransferase n=1 Tax=Skermanella stibiiresistens TaxID=913326 RepID=UPI0018DB5C61|nr:GNAT family N-acetyltransferase [Skermanella stibiiresistens]
MIHRDPATLDDVLPDVGDGDFYDTGTWYRVFAETCLDPGDRLSVEITGDGVALPMRERPDRVGPFGGVQLAWLGNYYTCRFGPLFTGTSDASEAVAAWGREVRRRTPRPARLVFSAVDERSTGLAALREGLRRASYLVETTEDFGNWYLPVSGDFDGYWSGRGARLRNTVERKERALRRDHAVELDIIDNPAEAERAIDLYERVHARSWKEPEPYPHFIPTLIREGMTAGAVRVGILLADGEPVASQLWIVWRGRATIFKLSYDERLRKLSAGSVLTRHMMREAFRVGDIVEIDFGCGDDPYKKDWLPERRQRWTLTAYDPLTACGAAHTLRRYLPRLIRRRLTGI